MTISRLTVDKLGVRLYDRVSAVLAELVANSYDADATRVVIEAPMGELLATRSQGRVIDKGFDIKVSDDGHGMTPDDINAFYLVVGAERRKDPKRGDTSKKFVRKVMGRKGVGKLAPFGICNRIEVVTSGGECVQGVDEDGNPSSGYLTAHLILERSNILNETDEEYHPEQGALDGCIRPAPGTTLTLSEFEHRHVPNIDDLARQMAQRFGVRGSDWQIELVNNTRTDNHPDGRRVVSAFDIETMPNTVIRLHGDRVEGLEGLLQADIKSGFEFEGRFYEVSGWIGYSKDPYKDDLMAGVRIYCRGKIAAQTAIFGRRAGFTGEYNVRSYLVGELRADWLDEDEDLIQTDRRDILWSHALGQAFETWGQQLVLRVGQGARQPLKKTMWETFQEKTDIERIVVETFPRDDQAAIRRDALELARLMAQNARGEEMLDPENQQSVVKLSLLLGPHLTLDRTMIEATDEGSPVTVLTSVLRTARIAELSSFGRIADNRVHVIELLEGKRAAREASESVYQRLIEEAPWLIDPQWSPLTANQRFSSLRRELEAFLSLRLGEEIGLASFSHPLKRVDFVLHNHDQSLELVEIKPPHHRFNSSDMERLDRYYKLMVEFLDDSANARFRASFPEFHITLVCDHLGISGVDRSAFDGFVLRGIIDHISWATFLDRTKQMHHEFLQEADRQRRLANTDSRSSDVESG